MGMGSGRSSSVYDHPFLYDLALSGGLDVETDFLEAVFDRHADLAIRRVVEYGCGTGRYLRALVRRGYETAGGDTRPAMVAFGMRRASEMRRPPRLHVGDMARWSPPTRYDAAINMASTLRYLTSTDELRSHFRRAAEALRPGGVYVLDLVLSTPRREPMIHEEWVRVRRGYRIGLRLRGYEVDPSRQVERALFSIVVKRGEERLATVGREKHRLITPDELRHLATGNELFRVAAVYGPTWDTRDLRHLKDGPGRRIIVLKRTDWEASGRAD
jgi:SAM-dependent methyltransferase